MRRTPVVLGVLGIVFGSLAALAAASNIVFANFAPAALKSLATALPQQPGHADLGPVVDHILRLRRDLAPYLYSFDGGKLLLSISLIIIGAGLYRRHLWSRTGAIAWGAAALLFLAWQIAVQVTVIEPRTIAFYAEMQRQGNVTTTAMSDMAASMRGIGWIVTALFYAPYPVLLLVLCGRASARDDFVS